MTATEALLQELQDQGVRISSDGCELRVRGSRAVLDSARTRIRAAKAELLEVLALDAALDGALNAESDEQFRAALRTFDTALHHDFLIETGVAHRAVARVGEGGSIVVSFEPVATTRASAKHNNT